MSLDATSVAAAEPWIVRTLGWRATRRPKPLVGTSLAGVAGVLLAVGVVTIGAAQARGDGGSGVAGTILSLVLVAAGLALLRLAPHPLPSAGTSALVIAVPSFWVFLLVVQSGSSSGDAATVLTAATLVGFYLFGPARGRAVFLALALLLIWGFVLGKTGDSGTFGTLQNESRTFSDSGSSLYNPATPSYLGAALVSLLFGFGFFAALMKLDTRRLFGIATAFVVPAIAATVSGTILLGEEWGVIAGALIGLAVGIAIALVGSRGQRRATAWSGALGALVAVVYLVGYVTKDASGPEAFGAAAIAGGVALAAAAVLLQLAFEEPDEDA